MASQQTEDSGSLFAIQWNNQQRLVHKVNEDHGFHDDDRVLDSCISVPAATEIAIRARLSERLALIHAEISEALEGARKGNPPDSHIPLYSSVEAELADAVIRIMDLAQQNNFRVSEAVIAKIAYNETREFRHGKVF